MIPQSYHLGKPASRRYVACVNEAVQVTSRLLDLFAHIVVAVQIEDVGDKVESILVVLNFCVETREIEAVGQVLLVDFAEVFVSAGRNKLRLALAVVPYCRNGTSKAS